MLNLDCAPTASLVMTTEGPGTADPEAHQSEHLVDMLSNFNQHKHAPFNTWHTHTHTVRPALVTARPSLARLTTVKVEDLPLSLVVQAPHPNRCLPA